jgi:squalene synthase HpnC
MSAGPIDPRTPVIDLLARFGPPGEALGAAGPEAATPEQALAYCRGLATSHYENFSVLSSLVPVDLRDDFAAVYAFCRWADDLGDETGSDAAARDRSTRLLDWWREQTRRCLTPDPAHAAAEHPVFVALARAHARHRLPVQPFLDLVDAFQQDQRVTRYQSWEDVLDYCRRSANPVGRLVLHLGGYPDTPEHAERYAMSDATCTALQLTNFWQDVRRDLLERDRVYIPERDTGVNAEQLRAWMARPDDPAARVPYITMLRGLVERTKPLFARGRPLPGLLSPRIAPVVWLFGAGGERVLAQVERIGCTTLWERPRLSKPAKLMLVARAWMMARRG